METQKASSNSTRWDDWIVWPLIIVALLSFWNPGRRLPAAMVSGAFLALVCAPFLLVGMSWTSFASLWRGGNGSRWQLWICLSGCVALSSALLVPRSPRVSMVDRVPRYKHGCARCRLLCTEITRIPTVLRWFDHGWLGSPNSHGDSVESRGTSRCGDCWLFYKRPC